MPQNEEEWKRIAVEFENKWNFPNCLGAVDGKHINIFSPANSGSMFFNYKKTFSIVLLAICSANYKFLMVDIGEAGRQSDAGVFANSNLGHAIMKDLLPCPKPRYLPGSKEPAPYVFVADDAFPLRLNIIKPYSQCQLDVERFVANYRISRARRTIENSFGILAARFRIFHQPINAKVEHVQSYTKAAVALHNFLMYNRPSEQNHYCPDGFADVDLPTRYIEGEWRREVEHDTGITSISRMCSNNYSKQAKDVRDLFCKYFNSQEGQVPWQWNLTTATR